jgi:ribosomal protein S18 acetylase RimI-like enzyme
MTGTASAAEPPDGLRWTTLDRASTPAWSELTNLLARVEGTEEFYSAADLAEELAESGFDPARDSWAAWDGDRLVAYGQLRVAAELLESGQCRAQLDAGVHPDWRGRGIGIRLMDALETRAREMASQHHPGVPLQLRASGRLPGDPVRPLLEHRGYRIARYFTDMERPLPGDPLPAADQHVRPYRSELSEKVRLAHNDAFATHWGSTARSAQAWREQLASRTFRPDSSTVWMQDGDVLGYVLTYQWVEGELYIGQVGTRQRARGRGLARACLLASLHAAVNSGRYHLVDLSVDSENPTGAGALYESVGFTATRTVASYIRDEPAPQA